MAVSKTEKEGAEVPGNIWEKVTNSEPPQDLVSRDPCLLKGHHPWLQLQFTCSHWPSHFQTHFIIPSQYFPGVLFCASCSEVKKICEPVNVPLEFSNSESPQQWEAFKAIIQIPLEKKRKVNVELEFLSRLKVVEPSFMPGSVNP